MMTKDLLKEAIKKMIEDGEFQRIYAHTPNKREKEKVKKLFDQLTYCSQVSSIDDLPIYVIIKSIDCADVWKDVISYMLTMEQKIIEATHNA